MDCWISIWAALRTKWIGLACGALIAAGLSTTGTAESMRPAFPGAIGFGRNATGWRGGEVVAITSLADAGPGTLRDCAENGDRPRICVFSLSGTIKLERPIRPGSNLYIAGQTAPGLGVQLRNGTSARSPIEIEEAHDIVLRFLKLRPGPSLEPSPVVDALSIENGERLYFGNLSLMFATDENFSLHVSGQVSSDITLERSIVAYGLDRSSHPKGKHSKGALICSKEGTDNQCGRVTLWGNLFAHNRDRNPDVNGTDIGPVEVVNNIFYNPISQFGELYDHTGNLRFVYVGNVAAKGPSTTLRAAWALEAFEYVDAHDITIIARDNQVLRRADCARNGQFSVLNPLARMKQAEDPEAPESVAALPSSEVLARIPLRVGDQIGGRRVSDPLDTLVLNSLAKCKGRIINSVEEVGGWPELAELFQRDRDEDGMSDDWETGRPGLDPDRPNDPWAIDIQTGLPVIEAYLANLAGDI